MNASNLSCADFTGGQGGPTEGRRIRNELRELLRQLDDAR